MIKKWIEFIKESKEELKKVWKLDKEEIKDLLIELSDLRYSINTEFGIVDDDGNFTKTLEIGDVNPAYSVYINDYNVKNGDVTLSLLTMCDYLESKGYEIITSDDDGVLNRESLIIDGGIFTHTHTQDDTEMLEDRYSIDGDLILFIKQLDNQTTMFKGTEKLDTYKITEKDFAEYHNWTGYGLIGNNIYLDITLKELASLILSSKSDYYDTLIDGIDEDNYYQYSERPDFESLFQYYLDNDNIRKLIETIIKDTGVELVRTLNSKLVDMDEKEIIEFLLNERYYTTLIKLCKENDDGIVDEIRTSYADMETWSHIKSNTKELYNAFDNIVDDLFEYTKFKKDDDQYYKIAFDEKWIEERDCDFLENLSLTGLLEEYCSSEYFSYDLNTNFSHYGDVNLKEFNKEVKSILK